MIKRRNNPNHTRTFAARLLTRLFATWTDLLINTRALARCKDALSTGQLFQQFAGRCRKPLKRLIGPSPSPHRAKALVLMRTCCGASGTFGLAAVLLLAFVGSTLAATHYVDVNSTNATPPYTNWSTAATNIQDAVDAAVADDEVVVTNGIYSTGGREMNNLTFNRVAVDKPLSVRSVNGPQFTIIEGHGASDSRCVYLTNSARLSGFALTNGRAQAPGGGVFCESQTAVVSNCTLTGNQLIGLYGSGGGGAYGGTLNNCLLNGNSSSGAAYCTLNNCTLSGNSHAVIELAFC